MRNALDKRLDPGIRYFEDDLRHREARVDAITALVLRDELEPADVSVLIAPFEGVIPLEVVGSDKR